MPSRHEGADEGACKRAGDKEDDEQHRQTGGAPLKFSKRNGQLSGVSAHERRVETAQTHKSDGVHPACQPSEREANEEPRLRIDTLSFHGTLDARLYLHLARRALSLHARSIQSSIFCVAASAAPAMVARSSAMRWMPRPES